MTAIFLRFSKANVHDLLLGFINAALTLLTGRLTLQDQKLTPYSPLD